MTPIGSEMIVSTLPDRKTSCCTFDSSTIPLTILILFFMCGFFPLRLASLTSYRGHQLSACSLTVVEQYQLTIAILSAIDDASSATTCFAPACADRNDKMPEPAMVNTTSV